MTTPVAPEIEYPTGDGKPMAETPIHRKNLNDLIEMLELWYADDPDVYVSGNMLMYYVEGDPRRHLAPDVFVVRGIPKDRRRDSFQIWREGKGPDLVIELTSASTADEDLEHKFHLYRDVLSVREYFLFDPRAEYLEPPLRGFRLEMGEYVPIEPVEDRLPSEVTGLHLEREGWRLRLYDPAMRRWLLTPRELSIESESVRQREAEARRNAEAGQRFAEAERQREAGRRAAEAERQREAEARRDAEAGRRAAEAERQREAEAHRIAEVERQREAEARRNAEAGQQREVEARRNAEAEQQREAEARRNAEVALAQSEAARWEAEAARRNAELALAQSEAARWEAEAGRWKAEAGYQTEAVARATAEIALTHSEMARLRAETEVARLRLELETLRQAGPKQP